MIHVLEPLRRFSPVLVVFPILCFLLLVFMFADNIPWMDDLEAFIAFLIDYTEADSWREKVHWLLVPNNEHRILFAKLTTIFFYSLTGTLNFRWLILVAFLCLLGIVYIFYRIFRTLKVPLIAFLPVTLILLQPQHRLTSFWAITALQHLAVAMMIFWMLYLLAVPNRSTIFSMRFAAALFLQALASFSMSNGLFGWAAGAGVLLVQWRLEGGKYPWRLLIWLVTGAVVVLFYFHDFASMQGNESSIPFLLENPHLVFFGFFTFLGGLFDFFPEANILTRSILPTVAGMLLFSLLAWLFKTKLLPDLWRPGRQSADPIVSHRRYFFIGVYVFLLVNAVIVAILRPRFGYEVMLVGNYMLYPALLVSALYLTTLSEFQNPVRRKQWVASSVMVAGLVWSVMYFYHLPRLAEQKLTRETSVFNQKYNNIGFGATLGSPYAIAAEQWMQTAAEKGFYTYPENTFYKPYEKILQKPAPPGSSDLRLVIRETEHDFQIVTDEWPLPSGINKACIVVKSKKHTYLFPAENLFFTVPYYLKNRMQNISARVFKSFLYPGTYQIGIFVIPNGKTDIRFSNQFINVQ